MATTLVWVNERRHQVAEGCTLWQLAAAIDPLADVVIYNGFPLANDCELHADDRVVLIRRGVAPALEDLQAAMVARHGPRVHDAVRAAKIGIAGCGGLGSNVAIHLARLGVGELVLADFDVVEPSNLNRQQFFVDQIGMPKVRALGDTLARISPFVRVHAHEARVTTENVRPFFGSCDAIAECFDAPSQKAMLAATCKKLLPATPLVTVSGIAGFGPASGIACRRVFGNVFLIGDRETAARPSVGLLSPRVGVAAAMQANVIMRLLLHEIGQTENE
jgi:sulfur carrier protein ThiS adenylyltransferase